MVTMNCINIQGKNICSLVVGVGQRNNFGKKNVCWNKNERALMAKLERLICYHIFLKYRTESLVLEAYRKIINFYKSLGD